MHKERGREKEDRERKGRDKEKGYKPRSPDWPRTS